MKSILKKFLSFSLFCMLLIASIIPVQTASATTRFTAIDDNNISWTYILYAGNATDVRLASDVSGELTVPSSLNGYPVTTVSGKSSSYSFLLTYGDNVTSVVFPNTLEEIGDYSLCNEDNILHVYIPEGVKKIGKMAFYKMENLTSIDLPSTLNALGYKAFAYSSFTKLTIPGNVNLWGSSSNSYDSFGRSKNYVCAYSKSLKSVTFKSGIKVIPSYCFYSCSALSSVSLPYSLTSVEKYAFYKCIYLSQIILNTNVSNIGMAAFGHCDGLGSIYILNPNATIYEHKLTISTAPIIYGFNGSTAEDYATKYSRSFKSLD